MLNKIKYYKFWLQALHSKGHGTHSPFVYDFIINVLNDDRSFYCFYQRFKHEDNTNEDKVDRLLFKMIDYYKCKNIISINASKKTNQYLKNANILANFNTASTFSQALFNDADFIYIEKDLVDIDNFLFKNYSTKIIVFNKPHSLNQLIWQKAIKNPNLLMTIDLYKLGVIVLNIDFKVKQHFNIRF